MFQIGPRRVRSKSPDRMQAVDGATVREIHKDMAVRRQPLLSGLRKKGWNLQSRVKQDCRVGFWFPKKSVLTFLRFGLRVSLEVFYCRFFAPCEVAVRLKKSSCPDLKCLLVQCFLMWFVPTAVPSDHWLGELYQQLSKMISAPRPDENHRQQRYHFHEKNFKFFFKSFSQKFFSGKTKRRDAV